MCEKMDISVQAFYDCKKSLAQKGIIQVTKGQKDYDIVLCGNDFTSYTDRDYKTGNVPYIRTNQKLFYDVNWKKLKPAQKLLVMDLLISMKQVDFVHTELSVKILSKNMQIQ